MSAKWNVVFCSASENDKSKKQKHDFKKYKDFLKLERMPYEKPKKAWQKEVAATE